ncbi:hypothetical protein B0A52_02449 [Exophiala mesophila]|uniref:Plasma membrane fusion protein PRM1 n=1 Tax=Exophiala mesophila TaxID=212818 RepID=A0A438NCS0_EXOME|nr:hypothetical protein B0A52_02449 [Exophiala mesophila]
MRTSTIVATIFLSASALAIPLQNSGSQDSAPQLATRDADLTHISRRRGLLDTILGTLTGSSGDATTALGDLLPAVITTVTNLDSAVNGILGGLTSDVDGTLSFLSSELKITTDKVNAIIADLDVDGTLDRVTDQLTGTIDSVQKLLKDVEALAATVDVGDLLTEVQSLLDLVTGLLGGLKKN